MKNVRVTTKKMQQVHGTQGRKQEKYVKLPRECKNYMVCRDVNRKNISEVTQKMQELHDIQGCKQEKYK